MEGVVYEGFYKMMLLFSLPDDKYVDNKKRVFFWGGEKGEGPE